MAGYKKREGEIPGIIQLYEEQKLAEEKAGRGFRREFGENQIRMIKDKNPNLSGKHILDYLIKASLTSANPALGEIHLTSYYSKAAGGYVGVPVWSYQWMIKQAAGQADYKGFEVVCEKKKLWRVKPSHLQGGGKMEEYETIVATCKVHRENRMPTVYEALWTECYRKGNNRRDTGEYVPSMWDNRPDLMLKKTAVAGALRWAFPEIFDGVYLEEEVGAENDAVEMVASVKADEMREEEIAKKQKEKESCLYNYKEIKKVVEAIGLLTEQLTGDLRQEEKIRFMKIYLKVNQYDHLHKKSLEEVVQIRDRLKELVVEKAEQANER